MAARTDDAAVRHAQVVDDLREESRELRALLDGLDGAQWAAPTPAEPWTVQDQLAHLAFFDDATVRAVREPEPFRREADALTAAGGDFPDRLVREQRGLSPQQVDAWSRAARDRLLDVLGRAAPGTRLPWYGPGMSVTSAATARLMETWAHGQDVADALGAVRTPTVRLRHVAHLGVATRAFSFALHGRQVPDADVAVELAAPDGSTWRWGDPLSQERVTGPALDFCLVVTQRRHVSDTALGITGGAAQAWMGLAQAYAGAPGRGRAPAG